MVNSIEQKKKNGRGKDKNGRTMHPNSLSNLKPVTWKPGQSGNPKGQSITARQNAMYDDICPYDPLGRTWREALAEGGMRMALTIPVALNNLQDRQEGKVTQPFSGSLEITDVKELTDAELAIITATHILENNAGGRSRRADKEAISS